MTRRLGIIAEMRCSCQSAASVEAIIRKRVGSLETVLRGRGHDLDAGTLSAADREQLQGSLDNAIGQAAQWCREQGLSVQQVRSVARRASCADSTHAFFKALMTNAMSSLVVNLAGLLVTIPLSLFVPIVPLIAVSLCLSVTLSWRYGMHAWAAGKALGKRHDESLNSRGYNRIFSQVLVPTTVTRALAQEGAAECARTGTRLLASLPLPLTAFVLFCMQTGEALLPLLGAVLSPIAALIGPVSNGLQELVSRRLSKRDGRCTQANLFGIRETGNGFSFDAIWATDNFARLNRSLVGCAFAPVRRLLRLYKTDFFRETKHEQERGLTVDKAKELFLGGMITGAAMGDIVGTVAYASGVTSPLVKLAASPATTAILGALHIAKRSPVEEAWRVEQNNTKLARGRCPMDGAINPAATSLISKYPSKGRAEPRRVATVGAGGEHMMERSPITMRKEVSAGHLHR